MYTKLTINLHFAKFFDNSAIFTAIKRPEKRKNINLLKSCKNAV